MHMINVITDASLRKIGPMV